MVSEGQYAGSHSTGDETQEQRGKQMVWRSQGTMAN